MDALVSAQVTAPPSDDQEKTASCYLQGTSKAEAEKQAEDTAEEDSDDDEDDIEITPGAVTTRAPVLFQSPSGKVLYFYFLRWFM